MKLVIEIPEEEYIRICDEPCTELALAVRNGIPLDSISTISVGVDGKAVQIYPNNAVLDKIRAEIEKINEYDLPKDKRTPSNIKEIIIDIIRKHTGV